ncbi:hypothetical protein CBL_10791 [Carabus blaptoides fortunei]
MHIDFGASGWALWDEPTSVFVIITWFLKEINLLHRFSVFILLAINQRRVMKDCPDLFYLWDDVNLVRFLLRGVRELETNCSLSTETNPRLMPYNCTVTTHTQVHALFPVPSEEEVDTVFVLMMAPPEFHII